MNKKVTVVEITDTGVQHKGKIKDSTIEVLSEHSTLKTSKQINMISKGNVYLHTVTTALNASITAPLVCLLFSIHPKKP